jgi:hypothetical protein
LYTKPPHDPDKPAVTPAQANAACAFDVRFVP